MLMNSTNNGGRSGDQRYRRLWYTEWATGIESALADEILQAAITLAGPKLAQGGDERTGVCRFGFGCQPGPFGLRRFDRAPQERIKLAEARSWKAPRGGKINLMEVEDFILDAHRRFNFFTVYFDPSQAELMAQRLRTRGVPMHAIPFTSASTQEMASSLLETFHSGQIELFRHHQLIRDIQQLRLIERGNGFRLDAARTAEGHADTAVSFLLALLAAKRNPTAFCRPFVDRSVCYTLDDADSPPSAINTMPPELQARRPTVSQEKHREQSSVPGSAGRLIRSRRFCRRMI